MSRRETQRVRGKVDSRVKRGICRDKEKGERHSDCVLVNLSSAGWSDADGGKDVREEGGSRDGGERRHLV